MLNSLLQGRAQYHSPVVAKQAFSRTEPLLTWRLLRWVMRKHPDTNLGWSGKKQWRSAGDRNRVLRQTLLQERAARK
jgi:RNA-directed DNA polymerase